jgi:hypothetical protein
MEKAQLILHLSMIKVFREADAISCPGRDQAILEIQFLQRCAARRKLREVPAIEPGIRQLQDLEVARDEGHAVQQSDSVAVSSEMNNPCVAVDGDPDPGVHYTTTLDYRLILVGKS